MFFPPLNPSEVERKPRRKDKCQLEEETMHPGSIGRKWQGPPKRAKGEPGQGVWELPAGGLVFMCICRAGVKSWAEPHIRSEVQVCSSWLGMLQLFWGSAQLTFSQRPVPAGIQSRGGRGAWELGSMRAQSERMCSCPLRRVLPQSVGSC